MKRILRRIILYANLASAILLVISFLSPHISPQRIWFPSFLGLAYPYILLLNLAFLLFWILVKRKEFIISLLAILLGWNTFTRYCSLHPGALFRKAHYENLSREDRVINRQLKVQSFNVRAFDLYRWTENPSAREEMIRMFRRDDAEIICLQEFYSREGGAFDPDALYGSLDRTPHHHIEYTIRNRVNRYGIAIFSFYPIVSRGRLDLNNSLSICSFADILVENDTLRIYNMHLQSIRLNNQHYRLIDSLKLRYDDQQMDEIRDISFRLRDAFIKRAAQADRIARHIAECPYPVIVCGDFNDTPVSYTYHRIGEGLQDAFAEAGWGVGRTYNGKFPSFRIDYILFGEEFEAMHFTRSKEKLSDHFPVTAYLQIR